LIFLSHGKLKLEIAVIEGRKKHEKRSFLKEKDNLKRARRKIHSNLL